MNDDKISSKNNFIFKFFSNKMKLPKVKYLIVGVLVLIVVGIFLSSFKVDNKKISSNPVVTDNSFSSLEYCEAVENRLINVIGSIKNIGTVKVFVMVESSPTIKYLEETVSSSTEKDGNKINTIETKIVYSKNGTITTPIVVVEILPKITGVLVVASGAKDIKIKTTLINTISSILSVDVENVEVLEGKG